MIENVLFKVAYPAEVPAQSAVEAALALHGEMTKRGKTAADIAKVTIWTHAACLRIIDKHGPLANLADRDHCIQYMVAKPLLYGRLTAADYEGDVAADRHIDTLRAKTVCVEDAGFSRDYLDPDKRSIANALKLQSNDGAELDEVTVGHPFGHRRRRAEGQPLLIEKFRGSVTRVFPTRQADDILTLCLDAKRLSATPVDRFVDMMAP